MSARHDKFSVLLLDGHGHHSQKVATCLGKIPGLKLHVLSDIRWPAVRWSRFVASFHQFRDATDEAGQCAELLRVSRAVRADVLLPVTESGLRLLARNQAQLAAEIRLPPLPRPELLETVINKFSLAGRLERLGIPTPATVLFTSLAAAERDVDHLPFPVLLKPVVGGGGTGIVRFDDRARLLQALRRNPPVPGSHILQSYVPGRDVGCGVLCQNGKILAHTLQGSARPRRNPFAVAETIQFTPQPAIQAVVEKNLATLGWEGFAQLDMREDERDGRLCIVDFNPRFWMSLLGSLAAGVNFPHLACLAALGIQFPAPVFEPINYLTALAALREPFGWSGGKTGLAYVWNDPGPRALNLLKRMRCC